jgi:serine/threonine-protein kinase
LLLLVWVLNLYTGLFTVLENRYFDRSSGLTGRVPSDQVVILAIDDASVASIGRWPWPRDVHAKVIDQLTDAKAKVVASTVFYFEPQADRGSSYLGRIRDALVPLTAAEPSLHPVLQLAEDGLRALDTDTTLSQSLNRSGRVVLPLVFETGSAFGSPEQPLPAFAQKSAVSPRAGIDLPQAVNVQLPLPTLGNAARAVGHLNHEQDAVDGVVRRESLLIQYGEQWMPSLSLVTTMQALNLTPKDVHFTGQGMLQLGRLQIPVDDKGRVLPQFYPDREDGPAFAVDSFHDFYSGKIPASRYAGKVVLIGTTAVGVGTAFPTAVSPVTSPVQVLAHSTSSLLSGHFFAQPAWVSSFTVVTMLCMALLVSVVLPRLSAAWAAVVTGVVASLLLLAGFVSIAAVQLWLPTVLPVGALLVAYLGLTTKRFLFTEASKIRADEASAETNRMMGLALQGQGQLDMAFDRFRRVPLGDGLMDNLANLALDFERKRQFNKAQAVYEWMATHNPQYKDLKARLKRVRSLSETVMLGGGASHKTASLTLTDGDIEQPMLGRYRVEKELGKGAMGVVYQGRDPKIGRVVAIKTMALAQEFDGAELDDARQRFFREAETAGRLQHPHIVTIYDAGEDQELAYIAMEFLKGRDLVAFTQRDHLLPVDRVLSIAARVADALHYAHALNVVHRDIKPANIMYEPSADVVKVTDFGIARITDASRTRTGMVLGTPSFMSPEQIAGKKVDGRSDLYSLGVTLFQLLSGVLPYRAESMAELMYKIANEPPPDVRQANPAIDSRVAAVVMRAMTKDLSVRYATGRDMAADLRSCLSPQPSGTQP